MKDKLRGTLQGICEWAYALCCKSWCLRKHLIQIRHVFELLHPETEAYQVRHTMYFFTLQFVFSVILLLLFWSQAVQDVKKWILVFALIYMGNGWLFHSFLWKKEMRLLKGLEDYLSSLRHYYHQSGSIEEAIAESMWESGRENGLILGRLYEVLVSGQEDEWERYRETAPDKFCFSFFTLCRITMEYGDVWEDGSSVFLKNINALKKEIRLEYLKRSALEQKLCGLFLISILPLFFLQAIEQWGISNLPELKKYYQGSYGVVVFSLLPLLSFLSYRVLLFLKRGNGRRYYQRNPLAARLVKRLGNVWKWFQYHFPGRVEYIRQLLRRAVWEDSWEEHLVKRMGVFLLTLALGAFLMVYAVSLEGKSIINDTRDYESTAFLEKGELSLAQQEIAAFCRKYRGEAPEKKVLEKKLKTAFWEEGSVLSDEDAGLLEKEIQRRIRLSNEKRIRFWHAALLLLAAYLASWLPLLSLAVRAFFIQRNLEDEVGQLQSVLIMLRKIKRMDIATMLDWMEYISFYFRKTLEECVDSYDFLGLEALENLREREAYPLFSHLVEDLENCDRVGVERAFEEMEGQKELFFEKRKQDNLYETENKGVIGRVTAFLPLCITIGFYLIVPFVLESLSQLEGYLNEVNM